MKKFEDEIKYIAEQMYRRYLIGKNPGTVEKKDNIYFKLIDYMFIGPKDIKVYFPKEIYEDTDLSDFLEMLSSIVYEYENENGDYFGLKIIETSGKDKNGYYFYYNTQFFELENVPRDKLWTYTEMLSNVGPLLEMKVQETTNIKVKPGTKFYELMEKIRKEKELENVLQRKHN